jgi:hypothetical protein
MHHAFEIHAQIKEPHLQNFYLPLSAGAIIAQCWIIRESRSTEPGDVHCQSGCWAPIYPPRGDHVEPMRASSSCARRHGNAPPAQLLVEPCRREACLAAENSGKWLMCWVACAAGCVVTGTACDAAPVGYGGDMWKERESGCEHCRRAPIQFQLLGFKLVTSWIDRIRQNFENSITNPRAEVSCVFY